MKNETESKISIGLRKYYRTVDGLRLREDKATRMKENNPMKKPEVVEKQQKQRKKNYENGKFKLGMTMENRKRASERMKINNPMKNKEVAKRVGVTIKTKYKNGELSPYIPSSDERIRMSERMKVNNPMKNALVAKKMGNTRSKRIREEKIKMPPNPMFNEIYKRKAIESFNRTVSRMTDEERSLKFGKGAIASSRVQNKRPNGFESRVIIILERLGLLGSFYVYSGNGTVWVGDSKVINPDFISINGKNVIECMGCYWHACKECKLNSAKMANDMRSREIIYSGINIRSLFLWEHSSVEELEIMIIDFVWNS